MQLVSFLPSIEGSDEFLDAFVFCCENVSIHGLSLALGDFVNYSFWF